MFVDENEDTILNDRAIRNETVFFVIVTLTRRMPCFAQ